MAMKQVMGVAGNLLGVLGLVVCLAAVATRLSGNFYLLNAETISVFQGGVGLMVAACLFKLWALQPR